MSQDVKRYGTVFIYALKDPRNNLIFYVGRTKNFQKRLAQHISEANLYHTNHIDINDRLWGDIEKVPFGTGVKRNVDKIRRILGIQQSGYAVEIEILDVWDAETLGMATKLEEAWIAQKRVEQQPITNYIYSHRMMPIWYGKTNKYYQEGWAKTPLEYIALLKSEKITDKRDDSSLLLEKALSKTRRGRKRLANKNRKKNNPNVKKTRRK